MKVCVFGAGAIGGFMGGMLAKAGHEVSLVARGPHLAALRSAGLRIETGGRTIVTRLAASERPEEFGPQDYVLVAVKAPALPSVVRSLTPLLDANTAVIFAMNGIPWWFFYGLRGPHDGRQLRSVDPDGALAAGVDPKRSSPLT